jgi:hypothetical protein
LWAKPRTDSTQFERSKNSSPTWCWVDIDLHQPGKMATVGQVVGKAIDMAEDGELPRPSLTVYSGRGVWFLWLLVGEDGYPPEAFDDKVLILETINRELSRRLAADMAACDCQRMLRVPGSTNTKADAGHEIVQFRFLPDLDATGRCSEYTLNELVEWLGLETPKKKKPQPKIVSGWNALWMYRFQDFRLLREMRGGFQEGCRNQALRLYANILQHLSFDDATIEEHLGRLAQECRPPDSGFFCIFADVGFRLIPDGRVALPQVLCCRRATVTTHRVGASPICRRGSCLPTGLAQPDSPGRVRNALSPRARQAREAIGLSRVKHAFCVRKQSLLMGNQHQCPRPTWRAA